MVLKACKFVTPGGRDLGVVKDPKVRVAGGMARARNWFALLGWINEVLMNRIVGGECAKPNMPSETK
jgi:hypothetical protein